MKIYTFNIYADAKVCGLVNKYMSKRTIRMINWNRYESKCTGIFKEIILVRE